jgi:FHS family L-fucose permease-like MFS transporter
MKQLERKNYNYALPVLISLFFVWGFLTSMNDVLIPFLKSVFTLTYTQAMIIQFSFFGAYFIGSLIYFIISSIWGDPINHIGYKNGIVLGLFMSAIGTGMFYPAAVIVSYGMFLTGLFILGLGFTLLQISSNPYVAILGSPQTASSRLNLAQGFNSLGTTLAPLLGGYLIFKLFVGDEFQNADALIYPYMAFTVIFILLGIAFLFIKLPDYKDTNEYSSLKITHYPQLMWGIIAIFMYVGAEVSIGSMLISFLKQPI